jgi:hypothetical protein
LLLGISQITTTACSFFRKMVMMIAFFGFTLHLN